jgi:hypothetical protein
VAKGSGMKYRIKIIARWLRDKLDRFIGETYVVIYDTVDDIGGEQEEYYGYFADEQEAREVFYDAFSPREVSNVKMCRVVETWQEHA